MFILMEMRGLQIRTVSGNLVNERIRKQITENLSIDLKWMEETFLPQCNHLEKRTFLVLLQDECDSEDQDTWKDVKRVWEVLVVHYLRDSNCGFIRFLSLKSGVEGERSSCEWQKELMKEAQSVLNKEAKRNGFLGMPEIFTSISVSPNSIRGWFPRCLYDSGFRLLETESLLQNISRTDHYKDYFLVYRPSLIPNYQVEDGALFDQVKAEVVLQFIKELLKFSNKYCDGINETESLQEYINHLEEKNWTMIESCGPSPDEQVAIIGGGMAGLAAAASLREVGFDVVLLEAANYLGGRIKQVQPFEGFAPIDLGGEFVHGSNTVINRIAMEKHWLVQPCYRCEGMEKADQFYHKGKLFPLFSDQPDIQAAWKAWDEIVGFGEKLLNAEQIRSSKNSPAELVNKCLASKHSDHTIVDAETKEGTFLANGLEGIADVHRIPLELDKDLSLMEWLKKKQCSEDVIAVFDTMYCQTVGVSPYHMGLCESAREESAWDYGYGNFRLTESYSQLVKYLLDKCADVDIRLSWQVKEIFWKGEDSVKTGAQAGDRILITSQHGEALTAKYAVIAVPLTILKDGDISFVPELPSDKKRAIDIIQMQGALKIVCRFRKRFWPDTLNLIYSVGGFLSQIWMYTRDSVNSDDKCHLVAGFLTAEPAEEKVNLTGKDVLDGFLKQLDEMFGTEDNPCPASQLFMDHVYYHWSKNPFVRGGYSSPTVHAYKLRQDLARSLDHRLFFAGEATSVKACATVHTAIETGVRAAGEICAESGKDCNVKL